MFKPVTPSETYTRLLSLDVFRGITMFLLMGEASGMYDALHENSHSGFLAVIATQFHHHPWNGLRFWDLIQPFFMFIVGVAMPFSYRKRIKIGASHSQVMKHILVRCCLLLVLGVGLHCVYSQKLVWELWNVLSQLSFTVLVTFLIMRMSIKYQLGISMILLVLTEIFYRLYNPDSPFVKDENFGSMMDMMLMGKINNGGGWVAINCLPTAAHTIWGAICGTLIINDSIDKSLLKKFVVTGSIFLVIGYSLDWLEITPIIKRIATTSFVFASGGWSLILLAFLIWLIDVKKMIKNPFFFTVVGLNPIFIYLFFETVGYQWLNETIRIFNDGIAMKVFSYDGKFLLITNAVLVWGMLWYLCYYLYKNRVFIRI